MRQQYHTRYTDQGRFLWDVKKLVQMTKEFPIKDIPLNDIRELEEDYWYEADLSYPIILCSKGRVMDGMHRICKAYLLEHQTIKAVQFEQDPEPHFINVSLNDLPYDD